jgi:hypothetical protein
MPIHDPAYALIAPCFTDVDTATAEEAFYQGSSTITRRHSQGEVLSPRLIRLVHTRDQVLHFGIGLVTDHLTRQNLRAQERPDIPLVLQGYVFDDEEEIRQVSDFKRIDLHKGPLCILFWQSTRNGVRWTHVR